MFRHFLSMALVACWVYSSHRVATAESPTATIAVDLSTVLREMTDNPVGINYNYLRDDDSNRPKDARPLTGAMKEMNVRWVRYPGGEKSDFHFFSTPPFNAPAPQTIGWYKRQVKESLDFDEYIQSLRAFGGAPFVVVPYDSIERTGKTKDEYLKHAVAWVRYSNVEKGYGVKYWEVGNENWHNNTGTAMEIGEVVRDVARAMKTVDPRIKVGCSGNSAAWFGKMLKTAGAEIDFLTVSNYFSRNQGYTVYRNTENMSLLSRSTQGALAALEDSPHKVRIELFVAEFGAVDFDRSRSMEDRWEGNDLGHAIVIFDMAGQILCEPRIRSGMFWTTRWMEDMNPVRRCYALGSRNEIMPVGRPVAIWGQFLKSQMVAVNSPEGLRTFATFDPAVKELTVFMINKGTVRRQLNLSIPPALGYSAAARYEFRGTDETDMNPVWQKTDPLKVREGGLTQVDLPAISITVLDFPLVLRPAK